MSKYLMLNSEILTTSKPCLSYDNRGLLYADAFNFEIRGNSSKIFFLDYYFNFLITAIRQLKMERPLLLKKSIFATDIELLLQKNRIYKGFKGKVAVFRNSSSDKLSEDNSVSILISVEAVDSERYVLNNKGIKINVLKNYFLPDYTFVSSYSPYYNSELLLMPFLKQNEYDDLLITDLNRNIVKSINSSVFFVKDGDLIVPERIPVNSNKIFSDIVISVARKMNINVIEQDVKSEDLYGFDELFFADIVNGIRHTIGIGEKRFLHKFALNILKSINEEASF